MDGWMPQSWVIIALSCAAAAALDSRAVQLTLQEEPRHYSFAMGAILSHHALSASRIGFPISSVTDHLHFPAAHCQQHQTSACALSSKSRWRQEGNHPSLILRRVGLERLPCRMYVHGTICSQSGLEVSIS